MTDNDSTKDKESYIFDRLFRWLGHFEYPIPADRLGQTLAQDAELLHLNVNAAYYQYEDCAALVVASCIAPCCIPFIVLGGFYCVYADAAKNHRFDDVAKARHLTLKENSLVYRIEADTVQSYEVGCWELETTKFKRSLEMVFSLDDPIELVKHTPGECCLPDDFITVRYKNTTLASVYATRTDIDEFIEKFNVQREIAKEQLKSRDIDQDQRTIHEAILDFYVELIKTEYPTSCNTTIREDLEKQHALQLYRTFAQRLAALGFSIEGYPGANNYNVQPVALPLAVAAPLVAEIVRDVEPRVATVHSKTKSLVDYTVQDVQGVLNTLGLPHHCISFEKANVDGALLKVMDDESLKELGVSSSMDRKKILAWVLRADRDGA